MSKNTGGSAYPSTGMDGEYFHFSRTDADPNNWCFPDAAAALIEDYGRRVPRAIDAIAGKLEEAIGEEDWNEAKSVLNDLWDLRDDGYKVEG